MLIVFIVIEISEWEIVNNYRMGFEVVTSALYLTSALSTDLLSHKSLVTPINPYLCWDNQSPYQQLELWKLQIFLCYSLLCNHCNSNNKMVQVSEQSLNRLNIVTHGWTNAPFCAFLAFFSLGMGSGRGNGWEGVDR